MKSHLKILFTLIAIGSILYVYGLIHVSFLMSEDPPEIKVGQVWSDCKITEDPFDEEYCLFFTILEIKGEYVKYEVIKSNLNTSAILSNKKSFFYDLKLEQDNE